MHIVIVSASTRIGRQTHKAALGLEKELQKSHNTQVSVLDLGYQKLPLFEEVMQPNADVSNPINQVHALLDSADALLFVTPEYNGSYSSALKNMVDFYPKNTFAKKAVGIVTISTGGQGGMRAAIQLQQLILALWAIPSPQMLLIPAVHQKFDDEGTLLDQAFSKSIDVFITEFLWLARALVMAK